MFKVLCSFQVQQEKPEGCIVQNIVNKDEDNSPNTLGDKNQEGSSKKFRPTKI